MRAAKSGMGDDEISDVTRLRYPSAQPDWSRRLIGVDSDFQVVHSIIMTMNSIPSSAAVIPSPRHSCAICPLHSCKVRWIPMIPCSFLAVHLVVLLFRDGGAEAAVNQQVGPENVVCEMMANCDLRAWLVAV